MTSIRDCKKIQPLLSEYVDGALTAETDWEVKLHVASCAVCAQAAQELTATRNLLRALPAREPSANFEAMLAKRLADTALQPRRESWRASASEWMSGLWKTPSLRPAFAVGAAALALMPFAMIALRATTRPDIATVTTGTPTPIVKASPANGANDTALEQVWREHSAYASSELLSDPASLVSTNSTTGTL